MNAFEEIFSNDAIECVDVLSTKIEWYKKQISSAEKEFAKLHYETMLFHAEMALADIRRLIKSAEIAIKSLKENSNA